MIKYRDFRPTAFDSPGAFLPDQQDWLVVPTGQNRDSGPLGRSNFRTALELLGGESDTVEVHRFGHWGPGWFEIIIVAPESEAAVKAAEIESRLADYPILNEFDYSDLEHEIAAETWETSSVHGRLDYCRRCNISIFAARRATLPDCSSGDLVSLLAE